MDFGLSKDLIYTFNNPTGGKACAARYFAQFETTAPETEILKNPSCNLIVFSQYFKELIYAIAIKAKPQIIKIKLFCFIFN